MGRDGAYSPHDVGNRKQMKKLNADWLGENEIQSIFDMLEKAGHEVYAVGGCVRNTLLNTRNENPVPVGDIDLTSSALPGEVSDIARSRGFKVVPTGFEHGTVTLVRNGKAVQITTLRKDVGTDGRHAFVEFGHDIKEDALRRDFTMNAIYASCDGTVHDPLDCGIKDLESGRVRFIGNARDRVREDYLRILRFFRIHAFYGNQDIEADEEGLTAASEFANRIVNLSRERIGSEMLSLLSAGNPFPAIKLMESSGVLDHVLHGANPMYLNDLIELEEIAGLEPDAMLRLAVIGGEDLAENLKLSRAHVKMLQRLIGEAAGKRDPAELGYRNGVDVASKILLLRISLHGQRELIARLDDVAIGAGAAMPVKAKDLLPECKGVLLGRALREIERNWIESGFSLSRKELLRQHKRVN